MSVLSMEQRVRVVHALCEGSSINATVRQTGVSKTAILRLLLRVGEGCAHIHNRLFRSLSCPLIEVDEQWSFIGKKGFRVTENDPKDWGEAYVFVGLDLQSRAVISFLVGRRAEQETSAFIDDLRSRLALAPQITTDGFSPYIEAIGRAFGGFVDYAQCMKDFRTGRRKDDDHRYEPPREPLVIKAPVYGIPDMKKATTSHVERVNLTTRMHVRRMTRLCNTFSKKLDHHWAAIAMHFAYYNLVRFHQAVNTAPAVPLRVLERPWTVAQLVEAAMDEAPTAKPKNERLKFPETRMTTARELPGGKGFLRVVGEAKLRSPDAQPQIQDPANESKQLDLWSWVMNRVPSWQQLDLFP